MPRSGRAQCLPTGPLNRLHKPLELARLKPGEHFNELATLSGDHLHHQANAVQPSQLRDRLQGAHLAVINLRDRPSWLGLIW